jgi:hypothetical protein
MNKYVVLVHARLYQEISEFRCGLNENKKAADRSKSNLPN